MDQLDSEIVESQKVRSDLLKWKIILVAALGAVGFGLSGKIPNVEYADLVLCCIPLVCAYVDALCRHLSLRIYVIGRFREERNGGGKKPANFQYYKDYENFVGVVRKRLAFSLESAAVVLSSLVFCVGLAYLPGALSRMEGAPPLPHGEAIGASGIVGLAFVVTIEIVYRLLRHVVKKTTISPAKEDARQDAPADGASLRR